MLRSVFAAATVVLLTIVFASAGILLTLVQPRGDWVFRMGKLWSRWICAAAGVSVDGRGAGNVPLEGPLVLVSNHQSYFDILAILHTVPRPIGVVAKRMLFRIPFFGWSLRMAGMIPIDRDRRDRAIESLGLAAEQVRSGRPVLLFPEGTRSFDGRMLAFKKGAFVIALQAGAPIVPISVSGGQKVLPRGSIRIRRGEISVRYGQPIPTEGYGLETKEALIARAREAVQEGLALIDPALRAPGDATASATEPASRS